MQLRSCLICAYKIIFSKITHTVTLLKDTSASTHYAPIKQLFPLAICPPRGPSKVTETLVQSTDPLFPLLH